MERLPEIMEILDKMNFFQGQRAGRELWNDKPFEVQEEDLGNFKRDIDTIGSYIWEIVKELKQYRDAEEQGLLLRLPCKVGDTVYKLWYANDIPYKVQAVTLRNLYGIVAMMEDGVFGKTVFLTKEEAEQALAKMKEV